MEKLNKVRDQKVMRKTPPPAETHAEVYYYKKQIDSHTLMVIVLQDGEEIEGTIEWYDKDALKINRKDAPNLMLLKHNIKYMYKAGDRVVNKEEKITKEEKPKEERTKKSKNE
jgi:sRNA-binding regulator protein Hfq